MPTAIRDVELDDTRPLTGLDGYERCMCVFRWRGTVVGRGHVPVRNGRVDTRAIDARASRALGRDALRVWLEDTLGFDGRSRLTVAERPAVTVAICTRDRPDDLRRTLAGVSRLSPAADEVLVVDNAPSTDRTRAVVSRCAGVRYVVESRPGLDRARNRAMLEAAGAVVAFTDDDAIPDPEWLDALVRNFADPRVLAVSGLTLPLELETPAQERFEEHCGFVRGFRRRVYDGRVDHPLQVSGIGAGANLAVRRGLTTLVGAFDELLDAGTPAMSGGDHDMFTRILAAGYRIVYEPRAVSRHRHRRTDDELHRVVRGYGTGVGAMWFGRLVGHHDLGVLRLAWRWFRHDHLPLLRRPMRLFRPDARDALRRAELAGLLGGPLAWLRGRLGGSRV
ncbi:MAG: glycosyltransferase family 2 protein [Vicinamibacterales bacterium]